MTDHQWTDRLSGSLEGEMRQDERAQLEAHLGACAGCAGTLEELREVVERAGSMTPRPPDADLWPGLESRLEPSATVVPFQPRTVARRFSFTMPQLVAAGLALIVMSGGGVWVLQHGGRATDLPHVAGAAGPGGGPAPPGGPPCAGARAGLRRGPTRGAPAPRPGRRR